MNNEYSQPEPQPIDPGSTDNNCKPDVQPMLKPLGTYRKETIEVQQKKAFQDSANGDTAADSLKALAAKERKACQWLEDVLVEYQYLNNCFASYAAKDIEGLKTILDEDVKKRGSFQTSFDDSITKLKAAKKQIGVVFVLAQKLKTEIANSCNSEEVKKMRDCLGKDPKKNLDTRVDEIVKNARRTNNQVDDLSETSVKVATINSFINLDTLSAFGTTIKDSGNLYIKDIQDNVKTGQASLDAGLKLLVTSLGNLSMGMQGKYKRNNTLEGWDSMTKNGETIEKFFSSHDCKVDCENIDDLAEKVQSSFDDKQTTMNPTTT